MKRKIILLSISGLAVLAAMLAMSYVTARPAVAQTSTPVWMECSDEQHFDVSAPGSPVGWSGTGVACGGTYTDCADVVGIYGTLDNVEYGGGGGSCGVDSRDNGVNPYGSDYPPSYGANIYPEMCADNDDVTCAGFGFDKLTTFNPENLYDELVGLGGVAQWCTGSNISFDARVCVMFQSPPPPLPECGGGEITDTHFISNSWTTSGAFWYYSFYDINPGGSVSKLGTFIDQYGEEMYGGEYIVTIIARSAETGTLTVSAGGAATPITITASPALHEYSGTLSMVGNGSGYVNVVMANAGGAMITVDQICLENSGVLACGLIWDYHFKNPYNWQSGGGAEWALNDPILGSPIGIWTMHYGGYIQQSISVSATGSYTVNVSARPSNGDTAAFIIMVNDVEAASVEIAGGLTEFKVYTATFAIDAAYAEFKIVVDSAATGAVLDWVCVYPGAVVSGIGPCGITSADMVNSSFYIYDPQLESGLILPIPTIGNVGVPMGASFGSDNGYNLLRGWQRSFTVNPIAALGDFEGLARTHNSGNALGLVPFPIGPNLVHQFSTIEEYNIVLRMRRMYGNARLLGNDQEFPGGELGEWQDAAIYIPAGGNRIELATDCGESIQVCTEPYGERTLAAVIIDDIYIVPGPELICGSMAPLTTTLGNCINPNPDFADGAADWQVFGGAYVDNVYEWAILPSGSYIQQGMPTGGAWGQSSGGLNVNYSYVIAVGAHREHANQGGQYTVIVGASQAGQLSFNHSLADDISTESTDYFTLTSSMLNGSQFDIRIINEAGGTVMLDYVCIRYNGAPGVTPPNGACLGTWLTSDGAAAVGPEIPSNNYVKNAQAAMGGGYALDLAGETDDEAGSSFVLEYCNATSSICDSIATIPLDQEFESTVTFVVPAGGYYGGELRLNNDDAVTYSNLCLRQSQNSPTPTTPPSPPPLPMPECGTVNNTASFYMLSPYQTEEYTGTEYSAAYAAEMTYNYAIYPLVCTTVSIGNWQYRAYAEWRALFNQYSTMMQSKLDYIIEILLAILEKIGTGGGGTPWWWDLLSLFLMLLKMFLDILIEILGLIFDLLGKAVDLLDKMMQDVRGENAIQYQFNCSDDNSMWICFVLAGVSELDYNVGDWLNIIALITVAMLTVSLAWWVVNQTRDMLQPGSGGDTSG